MPVSKYNLENFELATPEKDNKYSLDKFQIVEEPTEPAKKKVGKISFEESSLAKGNKLGQEPFKPIPPDEIPTVSLEPNYFDKLDERERLKNVGDFVVGGGTGGAGGSFNVSKESADRINEIENEAKEKGIDLDKLKSYTQNLNLTPQQRDRYSEMLITNPQGAYRILSHQQWKPQVLAKMNEAIANYESLGNKDAAESVRNEMSVINNLPSANTYSGNRQKLNNALPIIRKYSDNPEQAQKRLGEEATMIYGSNLVLNKGNMQTAETAAAGLNDYQAAALDYYKDLDPLKYDAYKGLLTPLKDVTAGMTPEEKAKFELTSKGLGDKYQKTQLGNQIQKKQLEDFGMGLKYNALTEMYAEAKNKGDINAANGFKQQIDDLENESRLSVNKYPLVKENEAKIATDEIYGSNLNYFARLGGKLSESFGKTWEGVENMAQSLNPFESETAKNQRLWATLGGSKAAETKYNLPTYNQLEITKDLKIDEDLNTQIEDIKKSNLSETEKRLKTEKLFSDNPDKWQWKAVDPTINASFKSIAYAFGDLATELAPYAAISFATGGGAAATGLRSFAAEFTGGLSTMYNDILSQSIERGDAHPELNAFVTTTISSLAMAGAGTGKAIREAAMQSKNPVIRKLIGNLSDAEINKALRYSPEAVSNLRKSYNIASNLAKDVMSHMGTAAKITGATEAANVVNQYIQQGEADFKDIPRNFLINTLKFGVFSSILGLRGAFRKPNEMQKVALFEAGKNYDEFIQTLDSQYKKGKFSQAEYEQIKNNIDNAKKVYDSMPKVIAKDSEGNDANVFVNAKGQPMSEAESRQLLFLKHQEADIDNILKSDIPKELADNLGKRLEGIQSDIDKVYKGTYLQEIAPKEPKAKELTKEAKYLLDSIGKGVYPPKIIDNLWSIAEENGIEMKEGMTVKDVVDLLKTKQTELKGEPQEVAEDTYQIDGKNVSKDEFLQAIKDKKAAAYDYSGDEPEVVNAIKSIGGTYEPGKTLEINEQGDTSITTKTEQPISAEVEKPEEPKTETGVPTGAEPISEGTTKVTPTVLEQQKADIEKTLYPTMSGSITLTDALPDGIYIDLGNGLFAFADKKAKIAAIVDKNNNNSVSKSFWNESKKEWQLPNRANLEEDAKRFNDVNYIDKIQKATDLLNAKYDAELKALEGTTETAPTPTTETPKELSSVEETAKALDEKKFNQNDATQQLVETLKPLERYKGVSIEIGGSAVGTGKKGVKINPHDTDIVFKVDDNVYFDENHPFWKQADAFANQEGIDVWIVSSGEVSKLESGSGNFLNRLNAIQNEAKKTIKNSIPIDDFNRSKIISEAYHKAKADGSNPELVKAVEELIGKPKEKIKEPTEVKENDTVELPPQIKGGIPRTMIFKDGEWKQKVGDQITNVGETIKKQAQEAFEQKNISSQYETVQPKGKRPTEPVKTNSEKVQYNGTDAIGSRTRTESEQIAARNEAKEKIKNPNTNASLKSANSYNESVGLPPVTSHKYKPSDAIEQTEIAKLYPKLQDVNSPTYKETEVERKIFSEYKDKYPEIFEQYDIKDYKDLVHKAYEQLKKETQLQYDALPVKVTFHENGEGNYENNFEMLDDVHNFNHLWVYKGGDDHTELGSKTRDENGLTANDKFRAVHDYYGHSVEGYQFGKDGEENAWIEHSKMFSPLAQWALSSETRGQNSWVNYSGVNEVTLEAIKTASALKKEGKKLGNQEMIDEANKILNKVYDDFKFAEQKAIILPIEFSNASKFHDIKISEVPKKLQKEPTTKAEVKEPVAEKPKEETKPIEKEITALQKATEARKAAKDKLSAIRKRMGIAKDPMEEAQALFDYHKALVSEAKEFIKEKVDDINEWAKSIGEKVNVVIQKAWDEAKGAKPIDKPEDLGYTAKDVFGEEWEAIRKAKQIEIEKVRKAYENQPVKTWNETMSNGLQKVQNMYPDDSLYDGASSLMRKMLMGDGHGDLTPDEALATMHYIKMETRGKRAALADEKDKYGQSVFTSENEEVRDAAILKDEIFKAQYENAALAAKELTTTAGRTLNYAQAEIMNDPEAGLRIRRMEFEKSKGEPLNDADKKFVDDNYKQMLELEKQKTEVEKQQMREAFEKAIDQLQKEYEKKLKQQPTTPKARKTKEEILNQKGDKTLADKIRQLKLKGTKLDFTFGTFNLLVEGVARLVETGKSIKEAIQQLVDEKKIGFKTEKDKEDAESLIYEKLTKPTIEETYDKIKKYVDDNKVDDITNEMVTKNLIREYVNSHIGEVEKADILDEAYKKIKEVFPDLTKERFIDAYLKEREFKQPTKKQLEGGIAEAKKELKKLAQEEFKASKSKNEIQSDLLKNAIKREENKIKEYQKKIDNEEFEKPEEETPTLKKKTAELIEIERKKKEIEQKFNDKKEEFEKKSKSPIQRIGDLVRSLYVNTLIGGFHTAAKVAEMGIARPAWESLRRKVVNKMLIDKLMPNLSKAALRGGEGSNWIGEAWKALTMQYSPQKIEKIYDDRSKAYDEAINKYNEYKNTSSPDPKKLQALKNDAYQKLVKAQGAFMYKFIGGSSLKDMWKALWDRSNEIEKHFGDLSKDKFKGEDLVGKIEYLAGFIGRSHGALKTPSARFSFALGYMARLEGELAAGTDITQPNKILEIADASYLDWLRGKYSQDNDVTKLTNYIKSKLENVDKKDTNPAFKKLAKSVSWFMSMQVPVARIPINLLHEKLTEYGLGLFKAGYLYSKERKAVKTEMAKEGYSKENQEEFDRIFNEKIKDIDPEQAATIVRSISKGTIGAATTAALYLLHFYIGLNYGGFPHKGQKKKKEPELLKEDELNPGQVEVNKDKLGEMWSDMITHNQAFYPALMGLSLAQSYSDEIRKGNISYEAAMKAALKHAKIIEGEIPQTKLLQPIEIMEGAVKGVKSKLTKFGIISEPKFDNKLKQSIQDFLDEKGLKISPPVKRNIKYEDYERMIGRRGEILNDLIENFKNNSDFFRDDQSIKENKDKIQEALEDFSRLATQRAKIELGIKEEKK